MPASLIDLRSDTVTRPTPAMRDAMMAAVVGDDVFGDDPTVNALQEKLATMFGHEAGLFCPSGTMANQIAINVHTRPGDEVICDAGAHIYQYEGGGMMANSGCSVKLMQGDRGRFTEQQVADAINPTEAYKARSRLVNIENTTNRGGGSVWDFQHIKEIRTLCGKNDLALHLDGARIFNALAVSGTSPKEIGTHFDSISICLSKGLGAPVGSVLLGTKSFIAQALRVRKRLGGGMRQVGIIAAAGLYAIDNHVERLKEDHSNAQELANALKNASFTDNVLPVETNIVVVELREGINTSEMVRAFTERNILIVPFGPRSLRFVTHLDANGTAIDRTVGAIGEIVT